MGLNRALRGIDTNARTWTSLAERMKRLAARRVGRPGKTESTKMSDEEHHIPPLIARGNLTFFRSLPELLNTHRGEWVAYSGEQLIGISRRDSDLVRRCHKLGLRNDQFVIRRVEHWDEYEVSPEEYVK